MKHFLLFLVALQVTQAFRQPPPQRHDISSSSMSSEEDSFEDVVRQHPPMKGQQQNDRKPIKSEPIRPKLFERPSSEELEAYDRKVQQEKKVDSPVMWKDVDVKQKPKMDEHDETMFLATLGQIYLEKADQENRFGPAPGPIGPAYPYVEPDYYFVPIEEDVPKQANNNGNNNVHVNVNHVQVNSNVLHVPDKKAPPPPPAPQEGPIVPAYHYSEPISQSKYLYLNLNMTDCVMLVVLVVAFLFVVKKTYKKCFPSKAPQLPVTLPPTYSPSTISVEIPKKVAQ